MSIQVFGMPVSRGVAIGRAVLVASSRIDVAHYFIAPADVSAEIDRLRKARDVVVGELEALKRELPEDARGELLALLDVHLMLLNDELLSGAIKQWIRERHYNAEWALSAQLEVVARQFDEMEDEYLRERKADLEQITERILRALTLGGQPTLDAQAAANVGFGGEEPLVLVANDVAPADILQFRRSVFQGFVTDMGGRTSHTAIVARSLDIPAVVGAREASRLIRQDDWLIIDGDAGVVIVNPSPIVLEEYRFRQRQSELERARLDRLRQTPALTLDGEVIELLANIELPGDAVAAAAAGAMGVGLFRSEFLFLNRGGVLPGEQEQYLAYRAAVEAMQGRRVVIRTIDVGADKPLERMSAHELRHEHVLNPALGLRAVRWSLSEPDMFCRQIRAILRAASHGGVSMLLPMVMNLREIVQTRELIERSRQELAREALAFGDVQLGIMVEVPAAALILPSLLAHVDFVSLGTNDLIQYTLAIDRSDDEVAHLYDPWHPAVLGLIASTLRACEQASKPVSICGEMAGDPQFTELLLALGLRSFSMHPTQIATVKQRVLRADRRKLAALVSQALDAEHPQQAWLDLTGRALERSAA